MTSPIDWFAWLILSERSPAVWSQIPTQARDKMHGERADCIENAATASRLNQMTLTKLKQGNESLCKLVKLRNMLKKHLKASRRSSGLQYSLIYAPKT